MEAYNEMFILGLWGSKTGQHVTMEPYYQNNHTLKNILTIFWKPKGVLNKQFENDDDDKASLMLQLTKNFVKLTNLKFI